MPTAVSFVLPDPCPIDGKPVHYSGRGRRPVYCSSACKAASNAATRPERRSVPVSREVYDHERAEDARWEIAARADVSLGPVSWGDSMIPAQRGARLRVRPASGPTSTTEAAGRNGAEPEVVSVPVDYRASVRPRATDPARRWIEDEIAAGRLPSSALADFGDDTDDGVSSTEVPRPRRSPRRP